MDNFKTTFILIAISVFIINLISDIYPSSRNRHTLMVVVSIITVYICISPLSSLVSSLTGLKTDFLNTSENVSQSTYNTELSSALKAQIEYDISLYANQVLAAETTVKASIENNELCSLLIIVNNSDNTVLEKEESVIKYVEEHYGVVPEIRVK